MVELATKAADKLRDDDWCKETLDRVGTTEPKASRGSRDAHLRMLVKFRGKSVRVRSNQAESPHPSVQEFHGYPFGSVSPGVYATSEHALVDACVFRLWVELGFADIRSVMGEMKNNHPREHAKLENARKMMTQRQKRESEAAMKAEKAAIRKRKHLESVTIPRLTEQEATFRALFDELSDGVKTLSATTYEQVLNPADPEADGKSGVVVSVQYDSLKERHRNHLQTKAVGCRLYFLHLANRAKDLLESATAALDAEESVEEDVRFEDGDEGDTRSHYVSPAHRIAEEVAFSLGDQYCGKTLRGWATEFQRQGSFSLDGRGTHRGEHLLDDEDVFLRVRAWLREKAKVRGYGTLSVDLFQAEVNINLIPDLLADDRFKELINRTLRRDDDDDAPRTISRETARRWMERCGAVYETRRAGYYTDLHEREDVVKMRLEYLHVNRELGWRTATWFQLEIDAYIRIREAQGDAWRDVEKPFFFVHADDGTAQETGEADATHVEIHVDQFEDPRRRDDATTSVRWVKGKPCTWGHVPERCLCHREIMRCGQDESIFKANALPRRCWVIAMQVIMAKKTEGIGEMASYFVDEEFGVGLPLTDDQLARVNEFRRNRMDGGDITPLDISPGGRYLEYGKNRDGYWGYEDIAKQVSDVLDVYETLRPDRQVVVEVDWSSGHAKAQEDGLSVRKMNIGIGQERKGGAIIPKTIGRGIADGGVILEPGCFNPNGQMHNCRPGGRQYFSFKRGEEVNPKEAHGKYADASARFDVSKGVRQLLWERGFPIAGDDGKYLHGDHLRETLANCEDFKNEVGALEKLVLDRGHILLMSPKGHPELAGSGIEYVWGKGKTDFRRDNTLSAARGQVVVDLHERVVKCLSGIDLQMLRRFARKAREYMRAYAREAGLFGWVGEGERLVGHAAIEKFVKCAKTHRCTLDQDWVFVTSGGMA